MTDNVGGKKSLVAGFRDDFKALSPKQLLAIVAAIALALLLEYMGLTSQCLGVLIIAVVLYMIPHFLKVISVRVKVVTGVVFILLSLLVGTYASGSLDDVNTEIRDTDTVAGIQLEYDEAEGAYVLSYEINPNGTLSFTGSSIGPDADAAADLWVPASGSLTAQIRVTGLDSGDTFAVSAVDSNDDAVTLSGISVAQSYQAGTDDEPSMTTVTLTVEDVAVLLQDGKEGTYYTLVIETEDGHGLSLDPVEDSNLRVAVLQQEVNMIAFHSFHSTKDVDSQEFKSSDLTLGADGWYSGKAVLEGVSAGTLGAIMVQMGEGDKAFAGYSFIYDTGMTSGDFTKACFYGGAYMTFEIALLFFIILAFSALMRRSAMKTREKMEAEGRLYPQGYGRCKSCGAMVLPGEVVCRKCGAYIDVPDEMRKHKNDYVVCSECGAEVPADAVVCPKCGARFDEKEEVEVSHADGTVDVTTETVPCPHCGEQIPANADWCPKCGKKVRD